MEKIKEYVRNEVRSYVRSQRLRSGLSPKIVFGRYALGELEATAERVPCCDLFPILSKITEPEDLNSWLEELRAEVFSLKGGCF